MSARGNQYSARGSAKDGKHQSDFEDIVPIVDDDDGDKFDGEIHVGEMMDDSMDFEPVIVEDDDHERGGHVTADKNNLHREKDGDEISERLSNDEELNLSRKFFTDKQIKSSRRYLYEDKAGAEDFDKIEAISN